MNVPGHRLKRNLERRRQLADQQVFAIKLVEYLAANRVGERAEHRVEHQIVSGFPDRHAAA
jgi:hypothetical protein